MASEVTPECEEGPEPLDPPSVIVPVQVAPTLGQVIYNMAAIQRLGIIQIAVGLTCFAFQVALLIVQSVSSHVGTGMWGGAIFIIAGALALTSSPPKKVGFLTIFTIMSLLATLAAIVIMTASSISFSLGFNSDFCIDRVDDPRCKENRGVRASLDGILVLLGIIEFFAVITAVLLRVCCGKRKAVRARPTGIRAEFGPVFTPPALEPPPYTEQEEAPPTYSQTVTD